MKYKMNNILNWFIKSSINPSSVSLTIKGLIPLLVLLGIDSALLDQSADSIVNVIVIIGQLITAIITLVGLARKILVSIKK